MTSEIADDTKLLSVKKDVEDSKVFQQELDALLLFEWTNHWLISFNKEKFKVIHYGTNNLNFN